MLNEYPKYAIKLREKIRGQNVLQSLKKSTNTNILILQKNLQAINIWNLI